MVIYITISRNCARLAYTIISLFLYRYHILPIVWLFQDISWFILADELRNNENQKVDKLLFGIWYQNYLTKKIVIFYFTGIHDLLLLKKKIN